MTVLTDGDWDTKFYWDRCGGGMLRSTVRPWTLSAHSHATISWDINESAAAGTYRILHHGTAKALSGHKSDFSGASSEFNVE